MSWPWVPLTQVWHWHNSLIKSLLCFSLISGSVFESYAALHVSLSQRCFHLGQCVLNQRERRKLLWKVEICLGVLKQLALESKRWMLSLDQTYMCWWGLSFTKNKAILISRESRRIYSCLYGAESENRKCKKIIAIHQSTLKPDLICAF